MRSSGSSASRRDGARRLRVSRKRRFVIRSNAEMGRSMLRPYNCKVAVRSKKIDATPGHSQSSPEPSRMKHLLHFAVTLFVALLVTATVGAQARPLDGSGVPKIYDRRLAQIEKIPLYDNHAHPGFGDDSDVDAMAAPPGETDFMRTRADNPEFITAAKQMLGYPYNDFSPEHMKWLADKSKAAEAAGDTKYFDSILDKLNTETVLANRALMAPYLDPKRFHWVFFVDSFFFPFDNSERTASTPDMGVYIPLQEKMLSRYKKFEGVEGLPADLAGYEDFIRRTMTDNVEKRGAVAMK